MKKFKTPTIILLVTLFMALLLLFTACDAFDSVENQYNVTVGDVQVTIDNCHNVLGDSNASVQYDPATKTLTLNNANINKYTEFSLSGGGKSISGLTAFDDINIVLVGENYITIDSSHGNIRGVSCSGSLNITGSGSLGISIKNTSADGYTFGFVCQKATTINNSWIYVEADGAYAYGIATNDVLTVRGGNTIVSSYGTTQSLSLKSVQLKDKLKGFWENKAQEFEPVNNLITDSHDCVIIATEELLAELLENKSDSDTTAHTHAYAITTITSTCTEQGSKIEKCACGYIKSETKLPLADHTPSKKQDGKDTVCTVCGTVLEKAGHIHSYAITTITSTCTEQGSKIEQCACGYIKSETKLPLADHTPSKKQDGKDTVCTVCGAVLEKATHQHSYTTTTTASTCIVQGKKIEQCACGDIKSSTTLPLAEHTPSTKVAGKDVVCTVCKIVLEKGMKPTTGDLSAGTVYSNALYNTQQLGEYSSEFNMSMKSMGLGIEYSGKLNSKGTETVGTASQKISFKKEIVYDYSYSDYDGYSIWSAEGKSTQNYPFDFADLGDGIIASFSSSTASKFKFKNSGNKSVLTLSLSDSEVWASYETIIDYMVIVAEYNIEGMEVGELTFTSAELTVTVKNDIINEYTLTLKGESDVVKVTIEMTTKVTAK